MESTYLFSYFSMKIYVVGTHRKPLSTSVHFSWKKKMPSLELSTTNIMFKGYRDHKTPSDT